MYSIMNIHEDCKMNAEAETNEPSTIATTFRLPIAYLEKSSIHELNKVVSDDLELVQIQDLSANDKNIYEHLFLPQHEYARNMITQWNQYYTSNQVFLNDTKKVVSSMDQYKERMNNTPYSIDCKKINHIWKNVREDPYFMEKYNYIDWQMFSQFNESASFLQCMTFVQVMSPAISFLLPILFLIFPFILLKIQGVPMTAESYVSSLKHIAKNHFIGKALVGMSSLSWDKLFYLAFLVAMYGFQIYQNVSICRRFYANVIQVNQNLLDLKEYVDYSLHSIEYFSDIVDTNTSTYGNFCNDMQECYSSLKQLQSDLNPIYPFELNISKFGEIGYMLKCYYQIHTNSAYASCIQYSVGFEGYINNLLGVHENLHSGTVSFASFNDQNNCTFKQQFYPVLSDSESVRNTCDFKKNMIISAPNKSGKTTILKTTAINIIFSQQVGCGFYQSASLTPYTHIHSYINIPDTSGRDSLFQAESRRCKEIIECIVENQDSNHRHFCMFDELYSGTNPTEASKAGYAFLQYLQEYSNVNYILTTHYLSICKQYKKSNVVQNYKMEVIVRPSGSLTYTYKLKKGMSRIKGGVRVLKDMNYPTKIIETIENM